FVLISLFSIAAEAQILKPATWSTKASKQNVSVGEELDLIFLVDIQKDWYLYSTDFDPDLGPMVTEFTFEPNQTYQLVGDIQPIGAKEKYDDLWQGNYTYFTEKAEFRQTIKVLKKDLVVRGTYGYQVCTDVDGKCIPFDDEFEFAGFTVNASASGEEKKVTAKELTSSRIEDKHKVSSEGDSIKTLEVKSDTSGTVSEIKTEQPVASEEIGDRQRQSLTDRASNDPYSLLGF